MKHPPWNSREIPGMPGHWAKWPGPQGRSRKPRVPLWAERLECSIINNRGALLKSQIRDQSPKLQNVAFTMLFSSHSVQAHISAAHSPSCSPDLPFPWPLCSTPLNMSLEVSILPEFCWSLAKCCCLFRGVLPLGQFLGISVLLYVQVPLEHPLLHPFLGLFPLWVPFVQSASPYFYSFPF